MDCVGPSGCQNGGECRTSEHRNLGDASAVNSSDSAASCDCPLGFGGDHCQEGEGTRTLCQKILCWATDLSEICKKLVLYKETHLVS